MNKLGYSERKVGHMTYVKWRKLYKAYKTNFDLELSLKLTRQRYSDIENSEDTRENIVAF